MGNAWWFVMGLLVGGLLGLIASEVFTPRVSQVPDPAPARPVRLAIDLDGDRMHGGSDARLYGSPVRECIECSERAQSDAELFACLQVKRAGCLVMNREQSPRFTRSVEALGRFGTDSCRCGERIGEL